MVEKETLSASSTVQGMSSPRFLFLGGNATFFGGIPLAHEDTWTQIVGFVLNIFLFWWHQVALILHQHLTVFIDNIFLLVSRHGDGSIEGHPWRLNQFIVFTLYQQQPIGY